MFTGLAPYLSLPPQSGPGLDVSPRRCQVAPVIDGKIGEAEWAHATKLTPAMRDEVNGTPSDEPLEVWISYDSKAVYLAVRAHGDPHKLIADEFRPNTNLGQNDQVAFLLDPKGGTNLNQFAVGPGGGYFIRLAGGRAAKIEWLGEMEVQSRITADGWESEVRLPWDVMDMPPAGTHAMRFNLAWFRSSKNRSFLYKYDGPEGQWPFLTGVSTGQIVRPRSVKFLPYGYLGIDDNGKGISNAGLDIKAPVSSNLDLVATVNPDFRNVENAILSLDFSYFARLANDPRPFFQEGAQYRRTGFFQRTFASQNIQDIDYGVNVYGSPDSRTQLGFLSTVDIGKQQTFVGTLSRQITPTDDTSVTYVGDLEPGIRSHTLDVNYSATRAKWNYYAGIRGTDDTVFKSGLQTDANVNYTDFKGFNQSVSFTSVSADYQPRLGFTPESDFMMVSTDTNWQRSFKGGPLISEYHYGNMTSANRITGGFYRNSVGSYNEYQFRNKLELGFYMGRPNFQGSADQESNAHIAYPNTDFNRRVSLELNTSRYGDIPFHKTSFNWAARPTRRIQSNLSTEFVEFDGRQTQIIGSLRFDKGRFESYGVRFVRRDSDLNWSASYRMSGKRGVEYFVVLGNPNATSFQKQLVLKVVAPVEIKF